MFMNKVKNQFQMYMYIQCTCIYSKGIQIGELICNFNSACNQLTTVTEFDCFYKKTGTSQTCNVVVGFIPIPYSFSEVDVIAGVRLPICPYLYSSKYIQYSLCFPQIKIWIQRLRVHACIMFLFNQGWMNDLFLQDFPDEACLIIGGGIIPQEYKVKIYVHSLLHI